MPSKYPSGIYRVLTNRNLGGLIFQLEDASKDKVLTIYRESHKSKPEKQTNELEASRIIDLHKVVWFLDDQVKIELTSRDVKVEYRGN